MIKHIERHIHSMRQKPEHIRKQYAFGVSFGITLIIFIFWIISIGVAGSVIPDTADASVKAPSPLSSLGASVGDAYGYVKDIIFGAPKMNYEAPVLEVSAGPK